MSLSSQPRASRAEVGLRSERGPILLAVMLSIGLVAIDSTILATAVPAVVASCSVIRQALQKGVLTVVVKFLTAASSCQVDGRSFQSCYLAPAGRASQAHNETP